MPTLIECATKAAKSIGMEDGIDPAHPWVRALRGSADPVMMADVLIKEGQDGLTLLRNELKTKHNVDVDVKPLESAKRFTPGEMLERATKAQEGPETSTIIPGVPDRVVVELEESGQATRPVLKSLHHFVSSYGETAKAILGMVKDTTEAGEKGPRRNISKEWYADYVKPWQNLQNIAQEAVVATAKQNKNATVDDVMKDIGARIFNRVTLRVTDVAALDAAKKALGTADINALVRELSASPEGTIFGKEGTVLMDAIRGSISVASDEFNAKLRLKANPTRKELAEQASLIQARIAINSQYAAVGTEQGRALQSRKKQSLMNFDRLMQLYSTKTKADGVVEMFNGTKLSPEKFKEFNAEFADAITLLDPTDQRQVDAFYINLHKASGADMVMEAYYASILSAFKTLGINKIGNLMALSLDRLEVNMADKWATLEHPQLAQITRLGSTLDHVTGAWKAASKAFKTELPSDPHSIHELAMHKGAIPSWITDTDDEGKWILRRAGVGEPGWGGKQVRLPSRVLLGSDEMMKYVHRGNYIHQQGVYAAYQALEAAKASGKRLSDKALVKIYRGVTEDPSQEVRNNAVEYARRLTWTSDLGRLGQLVTEARDVVTIGGLPVLKFALPFVRTPANILKYAADYTLPSTKILAFTKRAREDFAAGGIRAKQARIRSVMAAGIMASSFWAASQGLITGAAPRDPGERAAFLAHNTPWSVNIGNQQLPLNMYDPLATPIVIAASLPQILKDLNDPAHEGDVIDGLMGAMSDAVLDKTWFQGVQNVVDAITEPERHMDTLFGSMARTVVPSIVASAVNAYDPRATQPLTVLSAIQDRIAFDKGAKGNLKLDSYGREVGFEVVGSGKDDKGLHHVLNRFFSPLKATKADKDPVVAEMDNLRISIKDPSKNLNGHPLSDNQFYVLKKARGQAIYNGAKYAMSMPGWKTMTPYMKRTAIEDYVKGYATEAGKMALLTAYPKLMLDAENPLKKREFITRSGPTRETVNERGLGPNFSRGFGSGPREAP